MRDSFIEIENEKMMSIYCNSNTRDITICLK